MSRIISCRAQLEDDCSDGSLVARGEMVEEDGTWDGETIVCDACYLRLAPFTRSGAALNDELPDAIDLYSYNRDWILNHENPVELVNEAQGVVDFAVSRGRGDSPRAVSARALVKMAQAEVDRRQVERAANVPDPVDSPENLGRSGDEKVDPDLPHRDTPEIAPDRPRGTPDDDSR